jgi:hypothetical protein
MWERGKVHTVFWSRTLRVRDHKEDLGIDGVIILRWMFQEQSAVQG